MTVSTEINHEEYVGNGITYVFPYRFRIFKASNMAVVSVDANGVEKNLVLNTDFTLSGVGAYTGGNVTLTNPLPSGWGLTLTRELPAIQETDLRNQGTFFAETHEDAFDYLTMLIQQVGSWFTLALRKPTFLSNFYDAKQNRIVNLSDPVGTQDAVNNRSMRSYVEQMMSGVVGGFGWFIQFSVGAVYRTFQNKMSDTFSVKDFGAVGDYDTDDTAAIIAADTAASLEGKTLYFPAGVYRCTNGIDKKARWLGVGAPALGVFPIEDDKVYLRPWYKSRIPGATLMFSGTGTNTLTTLRTDDFASFTYCVKCDVFGSAMEGIAIAMDMNVYDESGNLTTAATDARANYDVGYIVNDAAQNYHRDVTVFGYFPVAGTVVLSVAGHDDPDYNVFHHGSSMGKRGVALIGYQNSTEGSAGLSGTQFISFDIFSNDHHSRSVETAVALYANASSWRCLYIDGYTSASTANINGHYFFGGCIRSYINNPIELDHASHTSFNGTIFETPLYSVPNSNATQYLASANTTDVSFITTRHSNDGGMANAAFGGSLVGQLILVGAPGNLTSGIVVAKKDPNSSTCYWVKVGADGGTGDPAIQMGSGSFGVSSSGWSLRRSISGGDNLDINYGGVTRLRVDKNGGQQKLAFATGGAKTIASGVITVAEYNSYSIDTEGAAATDDLDTISGGTVNGQILVLMAANSNRDVVLKDNTGNLRLTSDFTLTHAQDRIMLMYDGTNWCELSRADNTP